MGVTLFNPIVETTVGVHCFYPFLVKGKNSLGGILLYPFLLVKGKNSGRTFFFPLLMKGKNSGGYTLRRYTI